MCLTPTPREAVFDAFRVMQKLIRKYHRNWISIAELWLELTEISRIDELKRYCCKLKEQQRWFRLFVAIILVVVSIFIILLSEENGTGGVFKIGSFSLDGGGVASLFLLTAVLVYVRLDQQVNEYLNKTYKGISVNVVIVFFVFA